MRTPGATQKSDPPHVVLAALFAHFVVVEQHGEKGAVRAAPYPVAVGLTVADLLGDLEATGPGLLEPRLHLDSGSWLHAPNRKRESRRAPGVPVAGTPGW